ncbi:U1 small nuclear ribonucleoprotein C-like isoform X1 [Primulina huaijiensis]|uniref:U1 small nuclear ribonucleoprotein C-like isoform X1 n=1 Tax=Primulina huaijiensis TaxID=1492673 RepID=UPI003CC6DD39
MPRYYCDYCDTYLTHDSPSVRKQHNAGYKHKANIRAYYQKFEEQQTQILIDQKIKEHLGQATVYQQIGAAYNQHLAAFPGGRPRLPMMPSPMLPVPGAVVPHSTFGVRAPVLPTPFPVASGYAATQMAAPVTMQPPSASSFPHPPNGVPILPTMVVPSPISGAGPPPSSNGVQSATTQSTYEVNPSRTAASVATPAAGVYSYALDSQSSH